MERTCWCCYRKRVRTIFDLITLMWRRKFRLWAAFLCGVSMRKEDVDRKKVVARADTHGLRGSCSYKHVPHSAFYSHREQPPPPPGLWLVRGGVSWKEACEM